MMTISPDGITTEIYHKHYDYSLLDTKKYPHTNLKYCRKCKLRLVNKCYTKSAEEQKACDHYKG